VYLTCVVGDDCPVGCGQLRPLGQQCIEREVQVGLAPVTWAEVRHVIDKLKGRQLFAASAAPARRH
jgi:hypothetical protein